MPARGQTRRSTWHGAWRTLAAAGLGSTVALASATALAQSPPGAGTVGPQSGLPLPRYASLKSDRVNMRSGPATDTPILWVFRRAGLPVEILKEVEGWRQVRDGEGTTGWVSSVLISNRRTVQIAPWDAKVAKEQPPTVELKSDTSTRAATMALLESGVIASLASCDGTWCRITAGDAKGYVEQKRLWGVYPTEIVR